MPEKYVRREGVPLLLRHTGSTTLPERPPFPAEDDRSISTAAIPPVVCLHDAGLQSSMFQDLLLALEDAGVPALAFDLPGHGRSGSLDALPSIEAMAKVAEWVVEWCGLHQIVALGHGMGALVALDWATQSPERIDSLVLCGTGAALELEEEAIEAMRRVSRGKAPRPFDPGRVCKESGPPMMRRAYMEGIGTDPRATLGDLEAIRTWTRERTQQEKPRRAFAPEPFEGRVLLAEGESEPEGQQESTRRWLASVAPPLSVRIPKAAHFLPLEQPAQLAQEIRRFVLEGSERSQGGPA